MILTSASTRVDGSLGLRLATPTLTGPEKTAFFELQNRNLKVVLQPLDDPACDLKEIRTGLDDKTPSQRLRSVLFLLWKQEGETGDFDMYYRQKMNGLIDRVKGMLNA